ncbi:MAG TPA: hypothetical protein VFZ18_05535 [Longimicrobiaceae bacterium]
MGPRFLSSDPRGAELPWQTIDDLLDALEDGRLSAEDYLFDATRQAWQPIRNHSEVVEGWEQRMSYRPPEARRLLRNAVRRPEGFPALSPEGITPVSSPAVSRIEAARRAHALTPPEEIPAVRSAFAAGELGFVLLVLGLLGAGLVLLAQAFVGAISGG